jgi:hypothetical protein
MNPHEKGKFMFARFKALDGSNVAIAPYKVQALVEGTTLEGVKSTTIITDFGGEFEVQGSERAARSALKKASGAAPEAEAVSNEEAPAE